MWNSDSLLDLNPKIGPPFYITEETILKAIAKMKTGKAPGPSRIVIEMIRSAGKETIKSITNLANRIFKEGSIPSDWNLSYIVSLYKGKGDAVCRDNCRGLKLLDQVRKIIESVLDSVIRSPVDIDSMQLGLCQVGALQMQSSFYASYKRNIKVNINPCILLFST